MGSTNKSNKQRLAVTMKKNQPVRLCSEIALFDLNLWEVKMAGTKNPGAFRKLGITPARDFSHAWEIATKITGTSPATVVAPTFWTRRQFKFDVVA